MSKKKKMSKRYDSKKMKAAIAKRLSACEWLCENCGIGGPLVAAHAKSRNLGTASETENNFFMIHNDLHLYEHTRGRNLLSSPCVAKFISKHGEGGFSPWPNRLEFTPQGYEIKIEPPPHRGKIFCERGCQCEFCVKRREQNKKAQKKWREKHGRSRYTPKPLANGYIPGGKYGSKNKQSD